MLHLDEAALVEHVREQRWYGAKSRELVGANVLDTAVLRELDPALVLVLAELRYPEGTHDLYQLLLGTEAGVNDALAEDSPARELVHLIRGGAKIAAGDGSVEFNSVPGFTALARELQVARRIESEQSNTSVVFDEELILKIFRRLEPGLNPELELLRFLTEQGFANIPALGGWYAYIGRPLEATLGILQTFVPAAIDGWELALRELARAPDGFLGRLRRLGEVTGALHTALGSEPSDPAFSAEEPSAESLALLTATIDDEIETVFAELPADNEALEPIAGPCRGHPRAAARPGAARRDRQAHPTPRRLPPRPGALGVRRLARDRLRGRTRTAARGAPPEALSAPGRRGDAPFVRVRGLRSVGPARRRGPGGLGNPGTG